MILRERERGVCVKNRLFIKRAFAQMRCFQCSFLTAASPVGINAFLKTILTRILFFLVLGNCSLKLFVLVVFSAFNSIGVDFQAVSRNAKCIINLCIEQITEKFERKKSKNFYYR